MIKKVEIVFERGGTFEATLLENEAPETCKKIWEILPNEGIARHTIWSGRMLWWHLDETIQFWDPMAPTPKENASYVMQPGDIAYNVRRHEINIAYGYTEVSWRDQWQSRCTIDVNVFARVGPKDIQRLWQTGNRTRERGTEKIMIIRAE